MARPTLFSSPKFRRLVHLLKVPIPHAVGYLECLWSVAYECGEPVIGDEIDVEIAAQWPGDAGVLCRALVQVGLLDPADESGRHTIHDFWDHAPDYVKKRRERELERKDRSAKLKGTSVSVRRTADNGGQRRTLSAEKEETSPCGLTPAPTPAPSPSPTPTHTPDATRACVPFGEFWDRYPRKIAEGQARAAWEDLSPDEPTAAAIFDAIEAQAGSDQWLRGVIPAPAKWLRERRWLDELPKATGPPAPRPPGRTTAEKMAAYFPALEGT